MSESATTETVGSVLDSSPGVSGLPSSPLSRPWWSHNSGTLVGLWCSRKGCRRGPLGRCYYAAERLRVYETRDRLGGIAGNTEQFVRQQGCKPRGRNAAVCLAWVLWLLVLEGNPYTRQAPCYGFRLAFDACNRCGFVVHAWHGFAFA